MDEVCSSQLLTSVRRMVLTLTQQNDESKEFVKFFHKQLGSILQVRVCTCMTSISTMRLGFFFSAIFWHYTVDSSIQVDIHSSIHLG